MKAISPKSKSDLTNGVSIKEKDLLDSKQQEGESCDKFISRIVLKNAQLVSPFAEPDLVYTIMGNLNVQIRTLLGVRPIRTIEELKTLCQHAEALLIEPIPETTVFDLIKLKESLCKQLAELTDKVDLLCKPKTPEFPRIGGWYMDVVIPDLPLRLLIGTGTTHTILAYEYFDVLKMKGIHVEEQNEMEGTTYGMVKMEIPGVCHPTIKIGKRFEWTGAVYFLKDSIVHGILGMNTISCMLGCWSPGSGFFKLRNKERVPVISVPNDPEKAHLISVQLVPVAKAKGNQEAKQ